MQLNQAQAVLRQRNPWEAMDLGILLARRHAALLMGTWAAITLPLFALLTLIFWQHPAVSILIIWWLKPIFERLPLHILSNALFANTPSFTDSIKAVPRLLTPQLLASLTWRRLSMTRSFDLPVQQLEGLSGTARQQRLVTLGRNYTRTPTWLTIIGLHIEMALFIGVVVLLYLLIPAQLQVDWSWSKLLDISHAEWLWAEHLSNFIYVLVLIVWEPIYVACGFTLYLNRRTELEAWDIELAFRNLAQRLKNTAAAIVLALLCWLPYTESALAQAAATDTLNAQSEDLNIDDPRLLKQMLNSEQAQQSINSILNEAPFKNYKIIKNWHLGDSKDNPQNWPQLMAPEWLKSLVNHLSFTLQFLLWSLLLLGAALLFWRYRQWLRTFGQQLLPSKKYISAPKQNLLRLEITTESLPDDIVASAQKLWPNDPRAAFSLLYRGLLNHLLEEHALPLKPAHTEDEIVSMTQNLEAPLQQYSKRLTWHWKNLAWGHRLPNYSQFTELCTEWQQLQNQRREL